MNPASASAHWMRAGPNHPSSAVVMRWAAPLSPTSLPSIAPKPRMITSDPSVAPIPRVIAAIVRAGSSPEAKPTPRLMIRNAMNVSSLNQATRTTSVRIARSVRSSGIGEWRRS